jgi:PIN domain nuclease of toxin-antitoxin system
LNLLLDTHIFLWMLAGDKRLSSANVEILTNPNNTVFLSSVSIFEMATKARIKKLLLPPKYANRLTAIYDDFEYAELSMNAYHADFAGSLPGTRGDPFDRLLAAQAIVERMPIMTGDMAIRDLGAEVVW